MTGLTMIAAAALAGISAPSGLVPLTQAGKNAPLCSADGTLCVSGADEGAFTVTRKGSTIAQWIADKTQDDDHFLPLPTLVQLQDGGLLVAIGVRRSQMYSGGDAEVVFQRLMLVRSGKPAVEVLEAPYSSDISIRACFSEKDMKQRLDACADQYTLKGDITVQTGQYDGLPNLVLDVKATRFPRGVSRDADSLALPPLRRSDLVEETDPACTYRRTFVFDTRAEAYTPDSPLPACEDFTVP